MLLKTYYQELTIMMTKRVLAAVTGLLMIGSIAGCAAVGAPTASALNQTPAATAGRTITVVGGGTASGAPDRATAQLGIETQSTTPEQATRANNEQMTKLIAALTAAGIDAKDIQTTYYSVYTEQRYKPETGEATGEIVYHASASLSVTIRDISQVGAVLDKAVTAGANNISGVSFSVADTTKLEATAREKAVADARARAADLARLFGGQVGDVIEISEVVTGGPVPMLDKAMGLGGGGTPIQPGQLSISMQLQVTFTLK
ncbi:MAG TPA: SIMPL domain-containing protein [Anaerolineae bacterium]|nr:SIMPL domain-containing protein [Anaerolineae bacterium]